MLLTYARAFAVTAASVEFARGQIYAQLAAGEYGQIDGAHPVGIAALDSLRALKELCESIPSLNPVVDQIGRAEDKLNAGELPLVLFHELQNLQNRVFDELKTHFYYPVTAAYAATYGDPAPFGEDVHNNFPSARSDIQNAGRCIVLGQGTAGVFHLMRVMEVALRVLARDLGIDYQPDWGAYIRKINECIGLKHNSKSPAWKRKEPFYKDILGDLTSIKSSWRNPTMHIEQEYSVQYATRIYQSVMDLMQRMAEHKLKEKGKLIAPKVALSAQTD